MLVMKAYKVELAPNNKQRSLFGRCAGTARFVFNWGLATWGFWYEDGKKPSEYALRKQFNAVKKEEFPWVCEIPYSVSEGAFADLGNAFRNFFRRVKEGADKKGYPKYKRRNGRGSFHLRNTKVEHGRIRLTGIGWVRLKERGYIPTEGPYGTYATISEYAGRWYISVLVKTEADEPSNNSTLTIGIDFGIKTLAVLSNGEMFENPRCLKQAEKRLARLNRELSRRTKGGTNWRETKAKLQCQHKRVSDIRKHTLHQISHHVTETLKPGTIVLEDLNVSGMTKNRHLAGAISDVGFYELRREIEYKAARLGIEVIVADRWYASSKTCSGCSRKNSSLTLTDRTFCCPECGMEMDRDLNASINLASLAAEAA